MSFLTSGELAKLLKISKYLLRHYEDQQLIQPAFIDVNGYHMYGEEEVYRMSHMLLLREVGFSLKEMKDILEKKTDYTKALTDAQQNMEHEIKRLSNLKHNIQSILELQQQEIFQIRKERRETRYFSYLQDEYIDKAYNINLKKLAKWNNENVNILEKTSYSLSENGSKIKVMYEACGTENADHFFLEGTYYCKKIYVEQESDLYREIQIFYEDLAKIDNTFDDDILIHEEVQLSVFYLEAMVYSVEVRAND